MSLCFFISKLRHAAFKPGKDGMKRSQQQEETPVVGQSRHSATAIITQRMILC